MNREHSRERLNSGNNQSPSDHENSSISVNMSNDQNNNNNTCVIDQSEKRLLDLLSTQMTHAYHQMDTANSDATSNGQKTFKESGAYKKRARASSGISTPNSAEMVLRAPRI